MDFSFNLGENSQGNEYFLCFSLLKFSPSRLSLQNDSFSLFKVRVSALNIVSPVFMSCSEKDSRCSEKARLLPLSVQSVAAAARIDLTAASLYYSAEFFHCSEYSLTWLQFFMIHERFFWSLFGILPWFVTYLKNKQKQHKNTIKMLEI